MVQLSDIYAAAEQVFYNLHSPESLAHLKSLLRSYQTENPAKPAADLLRELSEPIRQAMCSVAHNSAYNQNSLRSFLIANEPKFGVSIPILLSAFNTDEVLETMLAGLLSDTFDNIACMRDLLKDNRICEAIPRASFTPMFHHKMMSPTNITAGAKPTEIYTAAFDALNDTANQSHYRRLQGLMRGYFSSDDYNEQAMIGQIVAAMNNSYRNPVQSPNSFKNVLNSYFRAKKPNASAAEIDRYASYAMTECAAKTCATLILSRRGDSLNSTSAVLHTFIGVTESGAEFSPAQIERPVLVV